ncbi:hypothetical protein GCM10022248_03190 [Nonomuraea soli]
MSASYRARSPTLSPRNIRPSYRTGGSSANHTDSFLQEIRPVAVNEVRATAPTLAVNERVIVPEGPSARWSWPIT